MTAAGVNATTLVFWVLCCSGLLILMGGILAIAVIAMKDDRPQPGQQDTHSQHTPRTSNQPDDGMHDINAGYPPDRRAITPLPPCMTAVRSAASPMAAPRGVGRAGQHGAAQAPPTMK